MSRRADLAPPLGYPGGPCHVVERIQDEVRSPRLRAELIEDVELGRKLDNSEASKVYDLEVERGPSGTRFKKLLITPHAQYRMDQRGIIVTEIRLALKSFQKHWSDRRSRGQSRSLDEDMMYGKPILWSDPKIRLTVVFVVPGGGNAARIITVYWEGQSDPRGPGEDACRTPKNLTGAAGDWGPGVQMNVSPKSEKNLPNDQDREKQQVLPSGAATPGGVAPEGGAADDGTRGVGKFEMNTPNNGIPDRPRTLPSPGEDYGVPYKNDYNMPTRRTMEGRLTQALLECERLALSPTLVASRFLEAKDWNPPKKSFPPAKRQTRQRGKDKRESRKDYIRKAPEKKRNQSNRHDRLQRNNRYKDFRSDYMKEYREHNERPFRRKGEGITFQYDQESPTQDTNYVVQSPRNLEDKGKIRPRAPGHGGPETHMDDADAPSSRVSPNGDGSFWSGEETYVKAAATIDEIAGRTSQVVHGRARQVSVRLRRANPATGMWLFQAKGSKGTYSIRVKGIRKGNVKNLIKAQVKVSCSCDFFRFQGPEHWAKTNNYLYGRPRGTAEAPKIKDSQGVNWICKHLAAALRLARKYRFSSKMTHLADAEIVPDFEWADQWGGSVISLADRFLTPGG